MPSDTTLLSPTHVIYPETDGLPVAENTLQFRWIVELFGNLTALYRLRDDVIVAADLFWYPVEGHPEIRLAPKVLLVFGRPRGDRGSYKQWEEGGIPLTVVFEVLSPGNTVLEMDDKRLFYEEHGVEEYYVLDPDHNRVMGFLRQGDVVTLSGRAWGAGIGGVIASCRGERCSMSPGHVPAKDS
jgi:Uma2 family endonuclease